MAQQIDTEFIIITGLSGSGKSAAIKCFEDLGFFCVDNLPVQLIPTFVQLCTKKGEEIRRIALLLDIRERAFLHHFPAIYNEMKKQGYNVTLLFMEASDEALVRRFSETRRPHPLALDRPVLQGIIEERDRLRPMREMADLLIDTSTINIHELREHINKLYAPSGANKPLVISIISFGYKHGIPFNSDIIFDVRFLPNPYFHPEFKDKTGLDSRVSEYVFESPDAKEFLDKMRDFLIFLMPKYEREGKTYLTISIGCTGGKHRSVAIADHLEKTLREKGYEARSRHRDLHKE